MKKQLLLVSILLCVVVPIKSMEEEGSQNLARLANEDLSGKTNLNLSEFFALLGTLNPDRSKLASDYHSLSLEDQEVAYVYLDAQFGSRLAQEIKINKRNRESHVKNRFRQALTDFNECRSVKTAIALLHCLAATPLLTEEKMKSVYIALETLELDTSPESLLDLEKQLQLLTAADKKNCAKQIKKNKHNSYTLTEKRHSW